MTLHQRKPLSRKTGLKHVSAKRRAHRASDEGQRDADHLARVRSLPCIICAEWGTRQTTPTEAHHVICGRYGTRKVPDRMTLPLCREHHRESDDPRKLAIHQGKATWAATYGPDYDWLPRVLDMLESE